jgi:hypothetical protein
MVYPRPAMKKKMALELQQKTGSAFLCKLLCSRFVSAFFFSNSMLVGLVFIVNLKLMSGMFGVCAEKFL